jgi:hypothetical protein
MLRSFVLLVVMPATALALTPTPAHGPPSVTHLPTPTAEPENGQSYAPPSQAIDLTPTAADIGPAQKHFVLASHTDDLMNDPNAPITNTDPSEPINIDKHIRIPLVHDVQDDYTYQGGTNDSLLYEIKYLNWGAITSEQIFAREGHYFTVTFVNHGPPTDFTTRLEYRQVKSKAVVRSLVQKKVHVSGAARAYFGVVGKAYLTYGPVSSWRFTVLRGDTVVAEAKSYLW